MSHEISGALITFAHLYIRADFRTRFLHEAVKKPGRLYWRVCHATEQLFDDRLKGAPVRWPTSQIYLSLSNTGLHVQSWGDAEGRPSLDEGLIIADEGRWFWARSECGRHLPAQDYSSPG
jgi:hypothetical protein